jgi:hypothetical protein
MLGICSPYIQASLGKNRVLISTNGRSHVYASEIQDHFLVPEYPHTSSEGILHYISLKEPLWTEDIYKGVKLDDKQVVSKIGTYINQFISTVSIIST